jgi:carbonic anhydrase
MPSCRSVAAVAALFAAACLPPAQARQADEAAAAAVAAGSPVAGAAPVPTADASGVSGDDAAVQRLRERLAERLQPGRPLDASVPLTLRADGRPAAAAAAGKAATAAAPRAGVKPVVARSDPARKPADASGAPWAYEGAVGPAAWATLKPEYAACAQGQRQSPIDLAGGLAVDLEPVRFHYKPGGFAVVDTGRTVQATLAPGNHIEVGGRRYELRRVQFHRPSEHRIDGRLFEMSAHLVHEDAQGRAAVVALLLDKGPAHPVVQAVWNHLPLEKHEENAARVMLDPGALLPADRRYYTYMGSLTAPPCTEGVLWVVMRTPVTVSADQVELFARIYPMNARPLQAAGGRRILQSQ